MKQLNEMSIVSNCFLPTTDWLRCQSIIQVQTLLHSFHTIAFVVSMFGGCFYKILFTTDTLEPLKILLVIVLLHP